MFCGVVELADATTGLLSELSEAEWTQVLKKLHFNEKKVINVLKKARNSSIPDAKQWLTVALQL